MPSSANQTRQDPSLIEPQRGISESQVRAEFERFDEQAAQDCQQF
jgi:hypothetical protein